jgi:hypothetical protein
MDSVRESDEAILRGLPPSAKLAAMTALIQQAFDLKAAWVRSTEPHLAEDEIRARARDLVAGGRT